MFETFQATLSPMLVMFMCMIIGYVAKKSRLVPDNTATVLSKLENYFFVPAAYGGDTSTGASMAMISHTLCIITIPLMYALLITLI